MKTIKAICVAALLGLSLSIPAYSDTAPGDSHSPGGNIPAPNESGMTPIGTEESTLPGSLAAEANISFMTFADIIGALASIY